VSSTTYTANPGVRLGKKQDRAGKPALSLLREINQEAGLQSQTEEEPSLKKVKDSFGEPDYNKDDSQHQGDIDQAPQAEREQTERPQNE
jgi:hypothetical protein